MFITIEGIDGAGKATHVNNIKEYFEKYIDVKVISFPCYETYTGKLIKDKLVNSKDVNSVDTKELDTLYALDRYNSFKSSNLGEYASNPNKLLIADRYVLSNIIYSLPKVKKEKREEIISFINNLEYKLLGIPKADENIVLIPEYELVISNLKSREGKTGGATGDINENDLGFMREIYKLYDSAYDYVPHVTNIYYKNFDNIKDTEEKIQAISNGIINTILDLFPSVSSLVQKTLESSRK